MFAPPSKRYRLYIDETGTQTLKKAHDDKFAPSVTQLKADLFGHSIDNPVILHRRDMVRGEGGFEGLKHDPFLAMDFERRWLELIEGAQFLAIAGAIDRALRYQ